MNQVKRAIPSIRFPVDDVTPATARLAEIPVQKALERMVKETVLICPRAQDLVVEGGDFHPLIAAAALAYKQHYPLVLSPEMIWLTVLQGVAQHINNNAEALRGKLVHHQTRIELLVKTELAQLPKDDEEMHAVAEQFVNQISMHVQPDKRFLLETAFSTTGDVERIVGAIVMMDAFQPYFDYVFAIICGIPAIVLEGSPQDWQLLEQKVQALHNSDLELAWWTKHLPPLCSQFVRASVGDVDRRHWKDICKLKEKYGVDDLNGWLLKFVPYVRKEKNEKPIHRNPVLDLTAVDVDKPESPFMITGCTSNMLPTGVSAAPVTCICQQDGSTHPYQFVGGLFGVSQSREDLSLRPLVGWAITEGSRVDALIKRLRFEHDATPSQGLANRDLLEKFEGYLPGDLWRFYMETDGGSVNLAQPNQWEESHVILCSLNFVKRLWDGKGVEGELSLLRKRGLLSDEDFEDRKRFNYAYSGLVIIGQAHSKENSAWYVFGRDPETQMLFRRIGASGETAPAKPRQSRGEIFRWTGQHQASAFTPVAHSFTDWLAELIE